MRTSLARLRIAVVVEDALAGRRFGFPLERAIFVTVLHRLFAPGSDRAAEHWVQRYRVSGHPDLQLQHLYRAIAWLGETIESPRELTSKGPPILTQRIKDEIEVALYNARRDLFSEMALVFFDTTTLSFDVEGGEELGEGGEELGEGGHSKDHRPETPQMVVGMVIDDRGNPVCSEMWPGNTADVASLVPVAARLKERFGIARICIVADRGMISDTTIAALEEMHWEYIFGARMRCCKDVSGEVLGDAGPFTTVHEARTKAKDPSPLAFKEVRHDGHRFIACHNEENVRKDHLDSDTILASRRESTGAPCEEPYYCGYICCI
jgi:hypothetical protein